MRAELEPGVLTLRDAANSAVVVATADVLLTGGRRLTRDLEWRIDSSAADHIVVRLAFVNRSDSPVRVEQLRPLIAERGYRGLPVDALEISSTGWQSWSRSYPPAPFEPNLTTAGPPIRGPWLPHRQPDSQVEAWMTLLRQLDGTSIVLGFLSAERQLGTIEIQPTAAGHALVAATELEGIEVAPGVEIVSEPLLMAEGSESALRDLYANRVATTMRARPQARAVLSGWCSWYQLYTTVSEADVMRNLLSLAAQRELLPLQLIQLDDGYQHAVGDWLELNAKFSQGMPALVGEIRRHGYTPGLWLAPFIVSARSHTYAQHPEWVVRDERGEPLNALDNWGAANYALDTTHPQALEWITHVVRTVCDDWGFEYLKLDFVYAAAMRGQRHDPNLTGVQAYRTGMLRLREVAGDRFLLGCGAPLLPSVGIVDGMRIGSDVAAYWGDEGNSDGPALRNATRATLARGWMHGRWWANDPDCVIVRAADTQLGLAEVEAWAAVVALSGGMLFVGDDVSRVEPERLALLARLIPPSGQAAEASPPLLNRMPSRLHLRVRRAWGEWSIVGIANWLDVPATATFDPLDFGLDTACHVVDLMRGHYLGRCRGSLELGQIEPHGLRLLSVHADLGRPQTVGSTGHLLGEAMDLAHEAWDASTRTLTLQPSANSPPARGGELLVVEPDGGLRRVPISRGAIELRFG
jgi:alpha-galactosidase